MADGINWASAKIFADTCKLAQEKTGRLVGTGFTARDLMRVVDVTEKDQLLRYWGMLISIYGMISLIA